MNIFISGVSKGIGNALLHYFLNLEHINKVFAVSTNKNFEVSHPKLNLIVADFTQENFINNIVSFVKDEAIHVLIHNSGFLKQLPFNQISPEIYSKTMDINFKAPFFLTQALLPNLVLGKAHIINIGSMGGFQGSSKFSGLSIYSASKAALANLTECLATELAQHHIKVNCFALGAVNTEMLKEAFPNYIAPVQPDQIAKIIGDFALNWSNCISGQIIPLTISNPA
jgi:NAD(P)-dependent dehydrogenase (short-subunit alcohol dehydrogenase family)